MQCQSYLPVYHSHYDLNVDANGGSRPLYNSNGAIRSGHYGNYVSSTAVALPQAAQRHFGYKELLRRTMLMQDVTFRDQVQELHRLYRRQKELMGEIKSKELYVNHLDLEVQSSNSSSTKFSTACVLNTVRGLPFLGSQYRPCSSDADNIQIALNYAKDQKTYESPVATLNGGTSNNSQTPEPKGKKIGGKLLDLELPAETYIDIDEDNSLVDVQISAFPTFASHPSDENSNSVVETDAVASSANTQLDPSSQGELSSPCLFLGTKRILADLNEPPTTFPLEKYIRVPGNDETNPEFSEKYLDPVLSRNSTPMKDVDKWIIKCVEEQTMKCVVQSDPANTELHPGASGIEASCNLDKRLLVVQGLPSITNQSPSRKRIKLCSKSKGPANDKLDASSRCTPSFDIPTSVESYRSESKLKDPVAHTPFNTSNQLKHANDVSFIDLNTSVTEHSEFTPDDSSSGKAFTGATGNVKYVTPQKSALSQVSSSCGDILISKQNSPNSSDCFDGETTKGSKRCKLIDINLPCGSTTDENLINEDVLVRPDYKNSEASLDRKTLEIELEAPVSPEVEERPPPRGNSEDDLTLQASIQEGEDSVVELAKSAAEAIVSMSGFEYHSFSSSGDLQKYEASDSGNLEWFAELIFSLPTDIENDFGTPEDIDDYEAMTLKLTEMKAEEDWCQNTVMISSMTCSVSLTGQTRKGRTKRSKRKDFQREVLPSLASLSRYEVTEDIQFIEGLMEAAGTPWQLRARRACRTGRKPRLIKQQMIPIDVLDFKCEAFVSWAKDNRRPRGPRRPASPSAIMSKWLEFAV